MTTASEADPLVAIDLPGVHGAAVANTQRIVESIDRDRFAAPTPCADWDVGALLEHIVVGNLWVAPLVEGLTIDEVGTRFDGDVLGDDPVGASRDAGGAARAAFEEPGAMDAPCAVSYGPVPGSVYCGHRFIDVLVHGWDLAVASGGDTDLPADLVDACLAVVLPQIDLLGGSGAYGNNADLGPSADPQIRLLALLGRTPPT